MGKHFDNYNQYELQEPESIEPKTNKEVPLTKNQDRVVKRFDGSGIKNKITELMFLCYQLPKVNTQSVESLDKRAQWYFQKCLEFKLKPNLSGLCNALRIDKTTFYKWMDNTNRKNDPQLQEWVRDIRALLEGVHESNMLEGQINPITGIFIAKNHYGYKDQVENIVQVQNPLGEMKDAHEIGKKYLTSVVEVEATECP